jgi:replicative DNA helicase
MKQKKKESPTSDFENNGRLMPQARDFEEAVLSAVMLERTAFETASNILAPDMFYDRVNEMIFTAFTELEADRKPIDLLTVVEQLRKTGRLEECGGASYISQLSMKAVSSAHLEYHCVVIREKYLRRRLIEACLSNTGLGFDETEEIDEVIAKLSSEIERIQEAVVGNSETNHISIPARKSIEQMHIRIANRREGITPGITTGFAGLDRITNGWQPEKFVIIAARPGVGKTSLAIHFAKRAAKKGTPVVLFSLEMGETELTDRMILSETDVNADDYNSGEIQMPEWSRVETAMTAITKLPVCIDANPNTTIREIANKARLLKKQGKCQMVIIDYLQLLKPEIREETREREVSTITRRLKIYAKELKIPFLVFCQMNRNIESEKREEQLSDLRESGSIEQDSDIVIFINRPGMNVESGEFRDKKTGELLENCIELRIKKHRSGRTGKVRIKHNESMTSFYDWDYSGMAKLSPVPQREIKNYYEKDETPF